MKKVNLVFDLSILSHKNQDIEIISSLPGFAESLGVMEMITTRKFLKDFQT